MENIRQKLSWLNISWWQRGTEEEFMQAKIYDKNHPELKGRGIKKWNDIAENYALQCLKMIELIKAETNKEDLKKIILEEIKKTGIVRYASTGI